MSATPKYINSRSGKSDRHQAHERAYAMSHAQRQPIKKESIEEWYLRKTTPKVKMAKPTPIKAQRVIGGERPQAKQDRDRERVNNYYMKQEDHDAATIDAIAVIVTN